MEEPNYVCISGGIYCAKDTKGKFIERHISCGDKVYLKFNYCFANMDYNNPCDIRPLHINGNVSYVEKFCKCITDDGGTEVYIRQENILHNFRPIIHKHFVTITFDTVKKMNDWLIDKPVNSIKDIKIGHKVFLVMYIDNGDD